MSSAVSEISDLEKSPIDSQFTSSATTRCNSPFQPEVGKQQLSYDDHDAPHNNRPEIDDEIDEVKHPLLKLPAWRKAIITFVASWMTFGGTFSSAALFPAVPEIAAEFGTTGEVINITNAAVFLAMGMSTLIWGPLASVD